MHTENIEEHYRRNKSIRSPAVDRILYLRIYLSAVEFVYLVFTRMPVRVTVGDPGPCCCVCVTSFERIINSLVC